MIFVDQYKFSGMWGNFANATPMFPNISGPAPIDWNGNPQSDFFMVSQEFDTA